MAFRNPGGGLAFSPPDNDSPAGKPDFVVNTAGEIDFNANTNFHASAAAGFFELLGETAGAIQVNGAAAELDVQAPSGNLRMGGAGGSDAIDLQTDGDTYIRGGLGKDLALRGKITGAGAGKTGRILIAMDEAGDKGPMIQLVPKGSAVYPDPTDRPYIHMGTNITICGMQQVNPGDLIAGAGQALPGAPAGYLAFLDASGVGGLHVPYWTR